LKPYVTFVVVLLVIINGGFKMKRTIIVFMLAVFAIAMVSAQGNNRWGQKQPRGPQSQSWNRGQQQRQFTPPESASVSGNLTIVQGMIAVKSNDTTYFVRGLNRYVGFIDGLKEGAAVKLEGFARTNPQDEKVKFMSVQKLTLNGKDYDVARPRGNANPGNARPGPGKVTPYPNRMQHPQPRQGGKR
jgi:hypothetical protein